jgi:antitoxin VapB
VYMPDQDPPFILHGDKIIPEPVEVGPFDIAAWRAKLGALDAADFLPDGIPDYAPVLPEDFGIDQ